MNGSFNAFKYFIINKTFNTICLGEALDQSFAVLPHAASQIIGDADINGAISFGGEDVDVIGTGNVSPGWPAFAGHDIFILPKLISRVDH